MKAKLELLDDLDFAKTAFYTVKVQGKALTEFEDFCKRMSASKKTKRQLGELNKQIENIGNLYGALDFQFKRENFAERLPSPTYHFFDSDGEADFGIRLYCVRLNDEAVILLNGDLKTAKKVKDCPNCKPHFDLANKLSNTIYNAKKNDDIEIDGRYILVEDDYLLEF